MVCKSKRTWCGSPTRTWCPLEDGHGVEVVYESIIENRHCVDVEERDSVEDSKVHGVKVSEEADEVQ
ncbi:hypothetical protein Tco_0757420 [Tanacetum coccineum]